MNLLFIPSLLSGDYKTFFLKFLIVVGLWILIFVATMIDLRTGIKASKARGNFRTTSKGLRQTLNKYKEYTSIMAIAFIVDFALSYLCTLESIFSFFGLFRVPLFSVIAFLFIVITEWISVKENIEKKKGAPIISKEIVDLTAELVAELGDDKIKAIVKLLKEKEDKK